MEHYTQGEIVEIASIVQIPGVSDAAVHMKVKCGSKPKNLLAFALKSLSSDENSQVVWHGSGKAVTKAISCAELHKRQFTAAHEHPLYQITKLYYQTIEEYWEPKQPGLDRIKVVKEIPAVAIVLSRAQLPMETVGFQDARADFKDIWMKKVLPREKAEQASATTSANHRQQQLQNASQKRKRPKEPDNRLTNAVKEMRSNNPQAQQARQQGK